MCPNRALTGEHTRNKRLVSENETDSKGLGASKSIGSPGRVVLGLRRGQAQTHKTENGAYNISPTTKFFVLEKLLTKKDVDRNSSCLPLAPR